MKNLTISGQKNIRALFSSTGRLQISFVEIILRYPVEITLTENKISCHFQYSEGFSNNLFFVFNVNLKSPKEVYFFGHPLVTKTTKRTMRTLTWNV